MDSMRVSGAPDPGSIPGEATFKTGHPLKLPTTGIPLPAKIVINHPIYSTILLNVNSVTTYRLPAQRNLYYFQKDST